MDAQKKTALIFEKEASRVIEGLSADGFALVDEGYIDTLKAKIRERLAARATLGDLPERYVCPAGHEGGWNEVEIIVTIDKGATWPLVAIQCSTCLELADMKDDPTQWADNEIALMGKQLKWIAERVGIRLAEIEGLLASASGSEAKKLRAEEKLIESLRSRVSLGDEE